MVKEGGAKVLVEHLAAQPGMTEQLATETVLGEIKSVKDIVASATLFQDPRYGTHARNYVRSQSAERQQEIKKTAAQESTNPGLYA